MTILFFSEFLFFAITFTITVFHKVWPTFHVWDWIKSINILSLLVCSSSVDSCPDAPEKSSEKGESETVSKTEDKENKPGKQTGVLTAFLSSRHPNCEHDVEFHIQIYPNNIQSIIQNTQSLKSCGSPRRSGWSVALSRLNIASREVVTWTLCTGTCVLGNRTQTACWSLETRLHGGQGLLNAEMEPSRLSVARWPYVCIICRMCVECVEY